MTSHDKAVSITLVGLFVAVAAVLMLICSLNATSGHNAPYKMNRDTKVIQAIAQACSNRPDTGTCIRTARWRY